MTKMDVIIKLLPVNLQKKTRAVLGVVALVASVAAVLYGDNPQVSLVIQGLITLGLLSRSADGSIEVTDPDDDLDSEGHLPAESEFVPEPELGDVTDEGSETL